MTYRSGQQPITWAWITAKSNNFLFTLEERNWISLILLVTWFNVYPAQSYLNAISCPTWRGRTTSSISFRKQAVGSTYWEIKRAGLSAKDLLTCYFPFVRSKTDSCVPSLINSTDDRAHPHGWDHPAPSHEDHTPQNAYKEAIHEHRLVTLQQRRIDLCSIPFRDIPISTHRLNSLLKLLHTPGYHLRH